MNEEIDKLIKAGKIASDVMREGEKLVNVGASLLDIAEKMENMMREKGGEPAFPINLSLNEIAAHYSPFKGDTTVIKENDVLKIDLGVHVDGFVADMAKSFYFNKEHEELVNASKTALDEAVKLCTPGTLVSDISAVIEESIKSFGLNPISNLTGHGLERYQLHTAPSIPNVKFSSDYRLKENQVIALEPFATNGAGRIKESEPVLIFMLLKSGAVRNPDGRKIISFAEKLNGLPFTERWIPVESRFKIRIALKELIERNLVHEYAPLKEVANGLVAQHEHSLIVHDPPIITTG